MKPPPPEAAHTIEDEIHEDHLRLAVLLDRIEDDLHDSLPVADHIAELTQGFEQHAMREELVLTSISSANYAEHRQGHDRMREMLRQLAEDNDSGADIRPNLYQVLRMFTDQLFPADAIFIGR